MLILGICDNLTVLKVIKMVKTIVTIIKIVVPSILILSCMISAIKAITSHDSEITSELLKKWLAKFIAALLIFLIPTFVNTIAGMTDANSSEFSKCFQMSTTDGITAAESNQARTYIQRARTSLLQADYSVALSAVNKIENQATKAELTKELNEVKYYIELKNQISELAQSYDSNKANSIYTKVNAINDEEIKNKLLAMLEEAGIGKPLNVAAGMYLRTFDGIKYYEVIPENATTRMPLVIYLEGGNPHKSFTISRSIIEGWQPTKAVLNGNAYKYQKFIYIYPDYTADDTKSFNRIMDVIKHVVKQYTIDEDHIVLTGVSNGATATFYLGYYYPKYFSALVPMCGPAYNYYYSLPKDLSKASSLVGTSLWSMTAGRGDFGNYEYKSKQLIKRIHEISPSSKALYASRVDEFKSVIKSELGKDATNVPNISIYKHCTITAYYNVPELWEWMLKQ